LQEYDKITRCKTHLSIKKCAIMNTN